LSFSTCIFRYPYGYKQTYNVNNFLHLHTNLLPNSGFTASGHFTHTNTASALHFFSTLTLIVFFETGYKRKEKERKEKNIKKRKKKKKSRATGEK